MQCCSSDINTELRSQSEDIPSPGRDQDSLSSTHIAISFHKVIAAAEGIVLTELESKVGEEGRLKFEKFLREVAEDEDEEVFDVELR